jgi:hypothetical protein
VVAVMFSAVVVAIAEVDVILNVGHFW